MPNSNKEKEIIEYFEPLPGEPPTDTLIVQHNDLITCRWPDLKLWESRIFFAALALIHKKDKNFKPTKIPITLLENMYNARVSKYDVIVKSNENLRKKSFFIKNEKEEVGINLFQLLGQSNESKDLKDGYIRFQINTLLEKYLLNLTTNFTKAELSNFIKLNQSCSRQLYLFFRSTLIKTTKVIKVITFDDLSNMLNKTYTNFSQLERKIIKPSVKEINEETDLSITYKGLKRGRKIAIIEFTIKIKNNSIKVNLSENEEEINKNIKNRLELITQLQHYGQLNIKVLDKLIHKHGLDNVIDEVRYACQNIKDMDNVNTLKNPIGYILKSVKDQVFHKKEDTDAKPKEQSPNLFDAADKEQQQNNDQTKEAVSTDNITPESPPEIDIEISEDRICKHLWNRVNYDIFNNRDSIYKYYKNIDKNTDEKLQLLSDLMNNDYYKKLNKPGFGILNNFVQNHRIPFVSDNTFWKYLHGLVFINKYYEKEYKIEDIFSDEEKAEIQKKVQAEQTKNEPLLTEADLKQMLKKLKNEHKKEIDLNTGLSAFYKKLKVYTSDNDERLINSFIQPKLAVIFRDRKNWYIINKFSLPTLTNEFETILTEIKNRKSDKLSRRNMGKL